MTLAGRIQQDLLGAMKSRDELRTSVLRMAKAAMKNREVEKRKPLDDSEAIPLLQSLVKQRRESVEQFTKGGRPDLAERETKEIGILEDYLPTAPTSEEMEQAVAAAIAEANASSRQQMGAVVKAARARLAGRNFDGKALSELVRIRLGG